MSVDRTTRRPLVAAALAAVAAAVVLRYVFVDVLTKTTGTWIGGVESPGARGT